MQNHDATAQLTESVQQAIDSSTALQIIGSNSKAFYGGKINGKPLLTNCHQGIIDYQPSELVVTARCGTPLIQISELLAEQGQMLAHEPPLFSDKATLGGNIACGFSGPARPFWGSARDIVLGCRIIDGRAQVMKFGGEVMKNVAGFDVSRLMVGSLGTLGVILDVSLKVLPLPESELTLMFEMNEADAIKQMQTFSMLSGSCSALSYDGQCLFLRLSGDENSVKSVARKTGGENLADSAGFWNQIKEHKHAFFKTNKNLWRFSMPPANDRICLAGDWFLDWGGAQRWLKSNEATDKVFRLATENQAQAGLFRSSDKPEVMFQPLSSGLMHIQHQIKLSFDPDQIFNPMRMQQAW